MTKPIVHRYKTIKQTYCGFDLTKRKSSTVSSFWEMVNCKKCLAELDKMTTLEVRQLSYWKG